MLSHLLGTTSGRFPRFIGTTKHSVFLPPLPRRFVSFARRYRRASFGFVPADARRSSCGPGVVNRTPHHRFIDGGDRTSQVPGGPHYKRALLFDPGGTSALGHYRASMSPSAFSTASAPARTVISGLNHTARSLAVYASQGGLPHHHARLASGWLASLSGRDWLPAGSQRKVSGHSIPLSQASPGARKIYGKDPRKWVSSVSFGTKPDDRGFLWTFVALNLCVQLRLY